MTTPEGRVKKKVKAVLDKYKVYYLMPVQMGYGAAGVDFHCVVRVDNFPLGFFIETKDKDKDFSTRQDLFAEDRLNEQNANTLRIDDDVGVERLERWLKLLQQCKILISVP